MLLWTLWHSRTFPSKGCSGYSRPWQDQENQAHHHLRKPSWPYNCSSDSSSPSLVKLQTRHCCHSCFEHYIKPGCPGYRDACAHASL